MKICIQGLWHLGSVISACLASRGHRVVGLEFDEELISRMREGRAPVMEAGVDALLSASIASGALTFIDSVDSIPADIEAFWVTYDTPVNEKDEADVEFVFAQVKRVLPMLPTCILILISSQLPVGSVRRFEKMANEIAPDKSFEFISVPENLRLGKAVDVFLNPDRVVIGVRASQDRKRILELFEPITDRIEWMSVESAEMTKHAINAFLATSIVFTNEIAAICEEVGADAKEVERGLRSESRIGAGAYVSPGAAFSGGTLARDVESLRRIGEEKQRAIPLLSSVLKSNEAHKAWMINTLKETLGDLNGVRIAVWGLSYKVGTDTLRRSLSVELCDALLARGAKIFVHDPHVGALPERWKNKVVRMENPISSLPDADALVLATAWPEYQSVSLADVKLKSGCVLVDANRFLFSQKNLKQLRYRAVGYGEVK